MPQKKPAKTRPAAPAAQPAQVDVTAGVGVLRRNPGLEAVIAVVDFVLAYLFFLNALDTGSLLQYTVGFLALILGVRSSKVVIKAILHRRSGRSRKGTN